MGMFGWGKSLREYVFIQTFLGRDNDDIWDGTFQNISWKKTPETPHYLRSFI